MLMREGGDSGGGGVAKGRKRGWGVRRISDITSASVQQPIKEPGMPMSDRILKLTSGAFSSRAQLVSTLAEAEVRYDLCSLTL